MKLKKLAMSVTLAAAAFGAQAAPLSSLSGDIDWKLQGYTTESGNHFLSNETTWGIGTITSLQDPNTSANVWNSGVDGYLYYMVYGIADLSITPGGTYGFNLANIGATGGAGDGKIHLDIYSSNTLFDFSTATLAGRTAYDQFTGVTTGPAYLKLEFTPGFVADDPTTPQDESLASLFQDVDGATLPATGKGTFYAAVVGGTAADKWNTDGFLGGAADMFGNYTLIPNLSGPRNHQVLNEQFPGKINDPVQSTALPEPGTLGLLGAALAGLGFIRRRKAA